MFTPFFKRLQVPPIHVAFEDIVPAASTAARVRQRAVYTDLIHQWPHFLNDVVRDRVERRLRPYRQQAWEGHLDPEAFCALLDAFLAFKTEFCRDMAALEAGWGDGIDVATWNALNQAYYSRSADNFFSAAYDEHLDKMLPQFPYARARAAHDIVRMWDGVHPINLIEIGAGSGAFAVELFLALKHQGKAVARVAYQGVEPSEAMQAVYQHNFLHRTGQTPLDAWKIATAGLEAFLDDTERYLTHEAANVLVFSYAAHHCYRPSLQRLIEDRSIQERVDTIYILDATAEHGWTKVYYMPLDCRSPEDFRNIALTGRWQSHTLWHEPFHPLEHSAVSRAWCAFRRLTPPQVLPQGRPGVFHARRAAGEGE